MIFHTRYDLVLAKDGNLLLFYDVVYNELLDDPIAHLTSFLSSKLNVSYSSNFVSSDDFEILFVFKF